MNSKQTENTKYSCEKIEENKSYVWHTEGDTKTLIAVTDTIEKAHFLSTAANSFSLPSKPVGDVEELEDILLMFGDAHNMLARTKLSSEDYQPISAILAKAKVDLFKFYSDLKSGYAAAPQKGMEGWIDASIRLPELDDEEAMELDGDFSFRKYVARFEENVINGFERAGLYTAKELREIKHDGYWEWLDESPSPSEAGDAIEIIDGYTQLAIDKRSLPKDGQHVKFMTENEEFHEGYFVGGDDIFHVTDSKFFFKWHVQQWKGI